MTKEEEERSLIIFSSLRIGDSILGGRWFTVEDIRGCEHHSIYSKAPTCRVCPGLIKFSNGDYVCYGFPFTDVKRVDEDLEKIWEELNV